MAALQYLVPIDLTQLELLNASMQKLASAPSTPVQGQFYFDTTLGFARIWDGTAWQRMSFLLDPYNRANHTGTQLANTISDFDTQVRTNRLDQMAIPTADLNINGHKLTNLSDPTSAQDAATMAWVLSQITGQDWKSSVRVATNAALPTNTRTGNVLTASANGILPAQDGVTLSVNDPILVKNEATGANNGIYTVTSLGAAGSPWVLTRRADADTSGEVTAGLSVDVTEGSTYADKSFTLSTDDPITLNTTALVFTQGPSSTTYLAGNGLILAGNVFAVNPGSGIIADGTSTRIDPAVVVRKFTTLIGNGVLTAIPVNHNLNNQFVQVAVFDASTNRQVMADVVLTNANTATINFALAPTTNAYRVVVLG
jgi:hypothetical protein